jgi:hypothetical protein
MLHQQCNNAVLNQVEEERKERALDELEVTRAALISIAEGIARRLSSEQGKVTSTEVIQEMIAQGFGPQLDLVDKRFMGVVFRPDRGWLHLGYAKLGSHRRPISVWRKAA